jgi:hypothetical protein
VNRVPRAGASALGCLLAAAVIVVAIPIPHAAAPAAISYRSDLASLVRLAPYPAVAPAGLPGSWVPVSSGLAVGGANGAGTVTWSLGYMTAGGSLASLEETNASPAGFIRRMTNSGTALGVARLAGRTWTLVSTPSRGQRSLYCTGPGGRYPLVVTSNATWTQLRELAASLRPAIG